jgi:hypothetical protein
MVFPAASLNDLIKKHSDLGMLGHATQLRNADSDNKIRVVFQNRFSCEERFCALVTCEQQATKIAVCKMPDTGASCFYSTVIPNASALDIAIKLCMTNWSERLHESHVETELALRTYLSELDASMKTQYWDPQMQL